MQTYRIPIWKTSPFSRLVIPLMAGIIIQWNSQFSFLFIIISIICYFTAFMLFYFLPIAIKFRLQFIQGILLILIIICFALFNTWRKDIRHTKDWYAHVCNDSSSFILKINEPVSEKPGSYKAEAVVETVIDNGRIIPVKGQLFVYFSKDSNAGLLRYGDRILIDGDLQRIRNSGNPGAFDYERYGAFQQVFYTIYLTSNDWILLKNKNINTVKKNIFSIRSYIINVLQKNIYGSKNVLGIAEALLIGYKEDLDRDLVQAYSNAGVVHIIAISGLHLGLIYIMLVWIFNRLPWIKKQKVIKVVLILFCLWMFSLLTGASASVLRSAVMFTCILIGKNYFRQTTMYNSLAGSAFILLCYDPYLLWDVGFQLSYLAIIGIAFLQKPIENLIYFKSKWLNKTWSMFAVTLAAQLFTFPVCIYYFHQFPNLFFITNLIAVPLSTVILFAEIFLIAFSWFPFIGMCIGKLTGGLIWIMNLIIQAFSKLPFSVFDNIHANLYTTTLLYLFIIGICGWLMTKSKACFHTALIGLLFFTALQTFAKLEVNEQKKIVIYNVPKQQAIDFIYHDKYFFLGDSDLVADGFLKNFHLKPARVSLQANTLSQHLTNLHHQNKEWAFFGKKMIVIDSAIHVQPVDESIKADILLISKNPSLHIADLLDAFKPSVIVFDASNSLWKIAIWKRECLALALPYFSIPEEGAFILDIE